MRFEKFVSTLEKLVKYTEGQMEQPWVEWPSVRELAKRYRVKQDDIIDMVESSENLDLIVGGRTGDGFWEYYRL